MFLILWKQNLESFGVRNYVVHLKVMYHSERCATKQKIVSSDSKEFETLSC